MRDGRACLYVCVIWLDLDNLFFDDAFAFLRTGFKCMSVVIG